MRTLVEQHSGPDKAKTIRGDRTRAQGRHRAPPRLSICGFVEKSILIRLILASVTNLRQLHCSISSLSKSFSRPRRRPQVAPWRSFKGIRKRLGVPRKFPQRERPALEIRVRYHGYNYPYSNSEAHGLPNDQRASVLRHGRNRHHKPRRPTRR
jgi:hypothetical protein